MTEAEKMAVRLEVRGQVHTDADHHGKWGALYAEAAALIRRLQAESDAKDALRMQGEAQVASLLVEIASLRAENEALRGKQAVLVALVQKAYHEGLGEGIKEHTTRRGGKGWYESRARAAIEVKHDP